MIWILVIHSTLGNPSNGHTMNQYESLWIDWPSPISVWAFFRVQSSGHTQSPSGMAKRLRWCCISMNWWMLIGHFEKLFVLFVLIQSYSPVKCFGPSPINIKVSTVFESINNASNHRTVLFVDHINCALKPNMDSQETGFGRSLSYRNWHDLLLSLSDGIHLLLVNTVKIEVSDITESWCYIIFLWIIIGIIQYHTWRYDALWTICNNHSPKNHHPGM